MYRQGGRSGVKASEQCAFHVFARLSSVIASRGSDKAAIVRRRATTRLVKNEPQDVDLPCIFVSQLIGCAMMLINY